MAPRSGLSLIECLVAICLLVIGSAGASATLLAAVRLQHRAQTGARIAVAARHHIAGFLSGPCPARDSAWTDWAAGPVTLHWRLTVSDSMAHLVGVGEPNPLLAPPHTAIEVQRRCRP
ncbi:MAG: type IV pilus modification PilV family protein [Candidatus Nanopelagicales bacterium]